MAQRRDLRIRNTQPKQTILVYLTSAPRELVATTRKATLAVFRKFNMFLSWDVMMCGETEVVQ